MDSPCIGDVGENKNSKTHYVVTKLVYSQFYSVRMRFGLVTGSDFDVSRSFLRSRYAWTLSNHRLKSGFMSLLQDRTQSNKKVT